MGEEQGLSQETIRQMVQLQCDAAGSVLKWANSKGLCDEPVYLFLRGKRSAGPSLLAAIGLERVVIHRLRSEGLQPPVGEVEGEVFSSLGASKAPSCGSSTVPETPSEGGE